MAKKTARQRKEIAQQRAIQQAVANVSTATARPDAPAAAPIAPIARSVEKTSDEFTYVRSDLRRIGFLALGIVSILVVLSFFIH
jgi:hypothetical protein